MTPSSRAKLRMTERKELKKLAAEPAAIDGEQVAMDVIGSR